VSNEYWTEACASGSETANSQVLPDDYTFKSYLSSIYMAVDNDYTEIFIGNFKDSWSSTNTLLKKGRIGCWDAGSSLHYQYFAPWE
jgi:hypothetical protein